MKTILSKTTFMYGCQCTKRLYLNKYHKELANPEDEELQVIFQRGTDVGVLAQDLFPNGVNAQGEEEWHSQKTADLTQQLLPAYDVIYEAAFMFEGVLCAVDILVRKGKKYYAYEVKSTTGVKDPHRTDAALQYYVLKQCGIELDDFCIVHLNNQYMRVGDLDVQQLFTATSVLEEVLAKQDFVHSQIGVLKKVLAGKSLPQIEVGDHCEKPYPCDFSNYCNGNAPTEETFEEEIDSSIYRDEEAITEFKSAVTYPIYFLDFETMMYAVPQYDYSCPYQQLPFQYSLHITDKKGKAPIHKAFLGDGLTDPREALIKQMIAETGTSGSVVVWNKTFEKTCMLKMAAQFPQYAEPLLSIVDRMVDLMVPFRKKQINSDAFMGSYSIKYVLPVIVPELSYQNLEINNGMMASTTYVELASMDLVKQAEVREQLLEYCKLDTLAMVKIWEWMEK